MAGMTQMTSTLDSTFETIFSFINFIIKKNCIGWFSFPFPSNFIGLLIYPDETNLKNIKL